MIYAEIEIIEKPYIISIGIFYKKKYIRDFLIHFRREKNTCGICWYAARAVDFQLSGVGGPMGKGQGIFDDNVCCGYGQSGLDTDGFDCLIFPNFVSTTRVGMMFGNEQCGRSNGLVTADGRLPGDGSGSNKTLCST